MPTHQTCPLPTPQGSGETLAALARLTEALTEHYGRQVGPPRQDLEQLQPTMQQFKLTVKKLKRKTVQELWCEMLLSQDGLGPEIAKAITAVYSTPRALFEEYRRVVVAALAQGRCGTTAARELLRDVKSSKGRSVGKGLSRKIYDNLFSYGNSAL